MKSKLQFISILLLAAALLVSASGCMVPGQEPETEPVVSTEAERTAALPNAETLYLPAAEAVRKAEELTLSIVSSKSIVIGEETFSEDCRQTLAYQGYGTEQMRASVSEDLRIGTYSVPSSAAYDSGAGYFTTGNGRFWGSMTANVFCARYAPAVLLDPSLYESIVAVNEGDTVIISFSQPVAIEDWMNLTDAVLIGSEGSAVLDSEGQLTESTYTVTYQQGRAQIQQTISVTIDTASAVIDAVDYSDYIFLDAPDAPLSLERACGYLLQAESVTANSMERVACDAYGDERVQKNALSMTGGVDAFAADLAISLSLINHSRAGEIAENDYTVRYADGHYQTWEDGELKSEQNTALPETVRKYCQDLLLSSIILPEYVSSVTVSNQGDRYVYSFTANEAFAQLMNQNACQTLYQAPDLLEALGVSEITDTVDAYLVIDKSTGLPAACGISYQGTFMIGKHTYSLILQTDQNYSLTGTE